MAKILIVMSKTPYPPRSDGVTIRMNPIFEYLCSKNDVDLLTVCDPRPRAKERADEARKFCRKVYEFRYSKENFVVRKLRTISGLLSFVRAPYNALRVWSTVSSKMVNQIVNDNYYDVILWVGMPDEIAAYLSIRDGHTPKMVLDWIDSPSLTYERSQLSKGNAIAKSIMQMGIRKWKNWERKINKQVDEAIYITRTDALYANSEQSSNISVVPNGILDDIPEDSNVKKMVGDEITLGFLGNMGYESNIKAALRLHAIFSKLLLNFPSLKLKIIGREPSDEIKSLADKNVIITGPVDSIWPDVFDTNIFVFPMMMGAGLQNKVLEALRAGKPVVTSSICAAGLDEGGENVVIIADSDDEYYHAITDLILSVDLVSVYQKRAVDFIKRYDWANILPKYEAVVIREAG